MDMTTTATLGTWARNTDTLTASYLEADTVRIDNSRGETVCVSVDEWLDRLDCLKDAGWVKR